MFGYIRPFKPYMRFYEFEIYNSFYCGLCKNLGKNYGQLYRLMLSYDFAFLGILHNAYNNSCNKIQRQHCVVHPISKKHCLCSVNNMDYTAAAAVISVYQKICDTAADSNFFISLLSKLLLRLMRKGYKKAGRKYPEIQNKIEYYMKMQSKLEREKCSSIDNACEPTAQIMAMIALEISKNDKDRENFSGFGYHLGRFIYIADAYEDLEKDIIKKNYNPLYLNYNDIEKAKQFAEENINMSLGMIAEFYSRIPIPKFKEILDNVVYLGLKNYKHINKKNKRKNASQPFEV